MTLDPKDIRILAVDDEAEDSNLHKMILGEAGFTVVTASTLREAREILETESFELVLADLQLPDGEGLELLVPARSKNPLALAVILTGYASTRNAVAAVKAGAYDYLIKPCSAESLVAAIRRAAEKYILTRALHERTQELVDLNDTLDRRVRAATQEIFSLNEKLKRYISDLVQTNNDQTRALEELAHELKNPLSVIWGYTSFLLRTPPDKFSEGELQRSLKSIKKNAHHLQMLIEELLDASRITSRKISLKKETFPAIEALQNALDGLNLQLEEAQIELSAECEEKCDVLADKTRLRQILVNLITNAIKFTPKGGKISVSAKNSDDGGVLFTVADTGTGMAPEQAQRVFERFYQIGEKGAHNPGLGLGLNIVEGLVKMHRGRVWVDSELGQGSRFYVFLPAERVASPSAISN